MTGEGVEETFLKCGRAILTKIETGKENARLSSKELSNHLEGMLKPNLPPFSLSSRPSGSRASRIRYPIWRLVSAKNHSKESALETKGSLLLALLPYTLWTRTKNKSSPAQSNRQSRTFPPQHIPLKQNPHPKRRGVNDTKQS